MEARTISINQHAFSLPELLTVVAIIGVLAAVAIPMMSGIPDASRRAVADDALERLNQAVHGYEMQVKDITNAAASGSDDEEAVLTLLTTQESTNSSFSKGNLFVTQNLTFPPSADTTIYRAQWTTNGVFELLTPGTNSTNAGSGLDLNVR